MYIKKTATIDQSLDVSRIHASVKVSGDATEYVRVRALQNGPLGMEFGVSESLGSRFALGQSLDILLVIDGNRTQFHAVIVDSHTDPEGGGTIISTRFFSELKCRSPREIDERQFARWSCIEEHYPRAVSPAPGRYGTFVSYEVRNISQEGMQLYTSIEHAYLIPGMCLSLTISLPTVGEALVAADVVRIGIVNDGVKEVLDVGVRLRRISKGTKRIFGQYLVQFSRFDHVDDLISEGFVPNNLVLGLRFSYLKSVEEYQELIAFRQSIYGSPHTDSCQIDALDQHARILVGRTGEKIVCAAQVRNPGLNSELVAENTVGWRDEFGPRDNYVELTRIEVGETNKLRVDCMFALLKFVCTNCLSDRRSSVALTCSPWADSALQKAGWKCIATDLSANGVYFCDPYGITANSNGRPLWWNYVWGDAFDFLLETGAINPTGVDRIVARIVRLLNPVSQFVFSFKKLRRTILETR